MTPETMPHKVQATHLARTAYLYVRQSTLRQVVENTESTQRQYALRQRAVALGWPAERIVTIDSDLGQSGASAADRAGSQRLVTEVSLGRTGEDGGSDPAHFNDRLLIGLKGTMSEAELHVLRARVQGGIRNKAQRGELAITPPIGLAYSTTGVLGLDPDTQAQAAFRLVFATFRRTGSAMAVVKTFRRQGLLFPRRVHAGPRQGEVVWAALGPSQGLRVLHNPRYAGAFVYGRIRTRKALDGRTPIVPVPAAEWNTVIRDAHPGYLSWDESQQPAAPPRERPRPGGRPPAEPAPRRPRPAAGAGDLRPLRGALERQTPAAQ